MLHALGQISFEEPQFLKARSSRDKLDFWKNSKRLEHGSLLALWYEPQASRGAAHRRQQQQQHGVAAAPATGSAAATGLAPELIFVTVVDRDARKLAGMSVIDSSSTNSGSVTELAQTGRCTLGVR